MASPSGSRVQYEPLYALAFQCFPNVDVSAGIDRQAVRRRKSTGDMSTETERPENLQSGPIQQPHLLVHAVDVVQIPLLGVSREVDVERRPEPTGATGDNHLVHVGAVLLEHLHPVVWASNTATRRFP